MDKVCDLSSRGVFYYGFAVKCANETSLLAIKGDTLTSAIILKTVNSRYLKVEINPIILISQSKFSGSRKFELSVV